MLSAHHKINVDTDLSTLKVAIFSDATPERNGVGTYYFDLKKALKPFVAEVQFYHPEFSKRSSRLSIPLPGDGTQRISIPPAKQIRKDISKSTPDVIIVSTPGPYGLLGMRIAKQHGIRLLAGFHTDFEKLSKLYWSRIFGKLTKTYFTFTHRMIFRNADLVLANSQEMLTVAEQLKPKRTKLMGTSIPAPFLEKPVTPINTPISQVIYAGRLASEKNIPDIIKAAEQLPDINFVIVGDGPLYGEASRASCQIGNLYCPGWLKRKQLLSEIDDSDLLLLPSSIESFGSIALEAMARGRLVLASSACGIFEWPDLGPHLFQINPNETLAESIQRICQLDPAILRTKARNSREAALAFNQDTVNYWLHEILLPTTEKVTQTDQFKEAREQS